MKYKLVVWGDISLPVPIKARWLVWTEQGVPLWYKTEPHWTVYGMWWSKNQHRTAEWGRAASYVCPTPEPGEWKTQKYWIGG